MQIDGHVQRPASSEAALRDWDGQERRHDGAWRQGVEGRLERIEAATECARKHREAFNQTYEPIMKEMLEAKARRAKLWALACEELVKKGIWGLLLFLAAALLLGLKSEVRRWLGI